MAQSLKDMLEALEKALAEHNPILLKKLRPGASDKALERFSTKLGQALPRDFLDFYRWRDGTRSEEVFWIETELLLSLKDVVGEKEMMDEIATGKASEGWGDEWWSPTWVPFLASESETYVLDTKGSFGGIPGQIVNVPRDTTERIILHSSFADWLNTYVETVQRGYLEAEDGEFYLKEECEELADALYRELNPGYPIVKIIAKH